MSSVRAELSTKNKYWISKSRYYELKYFCLQYDEWRTKYNTLGNISIPSVQSSEHSSNVSTPTENVAILRTLYFNKMKLIEDTAKETDSELYEYILKAVTQELSFTYLSTVMAIPCSKGTYYDRYRKFFWLLDKKKEGLYDL